jgi:hypothetical protein
MAITAKVFYETIAQDLMLKALTTDAIYDATGTQSGIYEGIKKVSAKTTTGLGIGSFSDDITWANVSSGSVSASDTPVINVSGGTTINYLELMGYDTVATIFVPYIVFTIDAEVFTYAGSITITSCTLEISDTIGTPA